MMKKYNVTVEFVGGNIVTIENVHKIDNKENCIELHDIYGTMAIIPHHAFVCFMANPVTKEGEEE